MEEDIERFETLLKTYSVSKSLLYSDKINKETSQSLKSEDVINNISRQIKALANNDTHSKIDNNKIKAFKEYKLTSISNIMLTLEPQKKHLVASTSENHCGYDTQLLLTTKEAEAVTDLGIGVTQEFENSFRLRSQSKVDSNIDGESISPDVLKKDVPPQLQLIQETIPYNRELLHSVNEENKKDNSIDVCNMQNFVSDCKAISSSPLLFSKKTKCEHNTSFLLESFEKFEAIAAPIVHDNYSDVEAMKKIINFKMLHNNKPQVTSQQRQYDDIRYYSESIHLSPILKLKTDQEEIKRHTNFDLPNNDEFIEEDILFSSNETDNDHNQVGELPLTCALQTSFYEQEHVLDKTIYVGFQTASNKSIQVLTDSFTRAKSILNDSYDTKKPINSLSLSELVEVYDSELNERKIKQNKNKAESSTTEACETGNDAFTNMIYSPDKENQLCRIRPRDENVLFKTNTIDAYTQEQIKIDDYMMQEFEENLCIHDNKLHTNLGVSNQQIIFNNEVQLKSNENTNAHSDHCRVQTSTSDKEQNELGKEEKQIKNLDMDDKKMYSNEYQTDITNSSGNGINQLFTGFKTASNKCIDISKEALVKSRKLLDEFHFQSSLTMDERDIKIYDSKNVRNNHFQGFTTASNKSINISDEAYAKSDKIYLDIELPFVLMDTNQNPNKNETIDKTHSEKQLFEVGKNDVDIKFGFKTASNIPINISKEALMKSRNFLQEFNCDNDIVINNDNETGQKMETLKLYTQKSYGFESNTCESNVMKGSMSKCSKKLHHLDCKKELCQGFQTASNNAINISGEGFKQSRKNFEEFCLIKHDADNYKENVGDEYDKKIRSIESLKDFSSIAENNPLKNHTNTKRMLDLDVDQEIENNYCNKESSYSNAGFTTESNKRAKILKETLIKSKNIVENKIRDQDFKFKESFKIPINKFSGLTNSMYVFQGLKTATSYPVKISDETLEKSKKIFQDTGDYNNCDLDHFKYQKREFNGSTTTKIGFQGFKTARNNPVKASAEALEKSKQIFQDIGNYNNCVLDQFQHQIREFSGLASTKNAFQGFKTASNNPVKISDEALEQSKKIFQHIDDCNNCDVDQFKHQKKEFSGLASTNNAFQGFKTASNNPVKISDEALEQSKKIFQDIDDCNNCDVDQFKHQKKEFNGLASTNNVFQGFKTASNNPVKISDEALEQSKKIFQDIDDCNNCDVDQFKHQKKEFNGLASTNKVFQGFKTASNNPVKISDEALEQSKKIFQDIDDCNNCDVDQFKHQKKEFSGLASTNNAFQGFKTASNNTVKISDEALEQIKKIFQDIDDCNNCDVDQFKHQKMEFIGLTSTNNAFQGFKTASNNPVKISDEALERSKKIFQDITTKDCDNHLPENQVVKNTAFNEIGFQTANNKLVNFSEEALKKSKIIFQDIDSNLKTMIKQKINYDIAFMQNAPVKTRTSGLQCERNILEARKTFVNKDKTPIKNFDISDMINTEVIQNFNDTMLTEDFLNKSPCNKRSGSPILSCPKAKKMKTKFANQPKFEANCEPTEKINRFIFSSNYKKYKKYKLLDVYEMDKVTNAIQSCKEVNYNIDNISSLEFFGARNEISYSKWTTVNIKKCFLELLNKNIIPDGWIENHIKLITLKLLSYEKRFPNTMQNVCSVCNVMEQLKYRYERELYNVERPAIRKILEKDEVPSRRMVLQVVNIYKDGVSVTETLDSAEDVELLLSDGWYCVKATLDKMLIKLVCEGKITTGTKLVTHGAELLNCEQGVAPWEDTSSVRLKIFGNSTRRAHWAAKLGFHGNGAILSYLTAVRPEGGKISQLRVIVTRVYPMLYVEKFDDGSTVTRSERLENLYQMKYEMERETMLEKIYEEVEKEFCMQASQCDSVDDDRKSLESGSQIYQLLKKSRDPTEFRDSLTHSQAEILQDYIDKRREISLQHLQSKLQSVLKKRGLNVTRNVVAMLKIRVADVYKQNITKAMITVWRPHESLLHLLGKEGTWLDIHNVVPTAVRYSEIQISAGKQSLFRKTSKVNDKMLNIARTFQRKCYSIQELTQNLYITTDYNEVDSVGFVFDIEPSVKEFDCKKQLFQNVFLADANKKIICINFWGGLKKFGFENILETEQVVACVNLQKRSGNTRKNIPQYRATEFTYFTKTPKIDVCRKLCEDLSKQFLSLDRRKFIQDCIILRNNLVNMRYGNIENISPYRFNNSDYNLSKNKIFINSPNGDPNLNINGLDFDSTFQQSDAVLHPKALLRKKEISERISKLQKYGEPPPLSSINIVNKSKNAVKPYRSPLISKTEFNSLSKNDELSSDKPQTDHSSALDNSDDEKCNNNKCTSPVLPYKRRTVNPVKLNFSKQNVSKDDPFGEDFETSPPLSLD